MLPIATLYMHRCMHIWPCFLSMWGNRPLWQRQYPTLLSLLFDISCDAVTIPCHYKVRYFTSLHHFLDHQPLDLCRRRTSCLPNPPAVHITLGQWYPCISPSTSSTCRWTKQCSSYACGVLRGGQVFASLNGSAIPGTRMTLDHSSRHSQYIEM